MNLQMILSLIGGIALFIFGMRQLGDSLQKAAGPSLANLLERMTSGKFRALMLGLVVTGIMQSSTTTTVMVVGFVNSGIMKLQQAIPVIMGANIGTTATAWLLSLTGLESSGSLLELLKPSSFTPILAMVGVFMMTVSKNPRRKDLGGVLAGFAILMFGMDMMTSAVSPMAQNPQFRNFFIMFENPWLGLLTGIVLTTILQSSSASVGILQALAATGTISIAMAFPIIMGQNIGTCWTALLSGVGATKAARRTSMVHLYFNIIGALFGMLVLSIFRNALPILNEPAGIAGVAVIHTIFNVASTAFMLPLSGFLEKLVIWSVPDRAETTEAVVMLDDRLLATPAFAVAQCRTLIARMADMAHGSIIKALGLLDHYDEKIAEQIESEEDQVDHYEDVLGTFVVKLNNQNLSEVEGRDATYILHGIGDIERISDHSINLMEAAREIHEKSIQFTEQANAELKVLFLAVGRVLDMAMDAFNRGDVDLAKRVEPLEQVVDDLSRELKSRHIKRLRAGRCTVETGFVFAELLNNLERVADHCSNLAVCVIELNENEYNVHEYIAKIGRMEEFTALYRQALAQYALPEEAQAAPALPEGAGESLITQEERNSL